jgi:hypothetical protein
MTIHGVKTPNGLSSIDAHLDKRLSEKIAKMAEVLDDDDLKAIALDSSLSSNKDSDVPFDEILDLIEALGPN